MNIKFSKEKMPMVFMNSWGDQNRKIECGWAEKGRQGRKYGGGK